MDSSQRNVPNVVPKAPTFSSFKKKPQIEKATKPGSIKEESRTKGKAKRTRKRRERSADSEASLEKHFDNSKIPKKEINRSPNHQRTLEKFSDISLLTKEEPSSEFFPKYLTTEYGAYLNTQVDKHYKEFGTFDQTKIPNFKQFGDGLAIGLGSDWRISKKEYGKLRYFHPAPTATYKKSQRYMSFGTSEPVRFLKPKREYLEARDAEVPSYISLEPSQVSTPMEEEHPNKTEENLASREKIKEYEVKVKENPYDISTWLEYIDFQSKVESFKSKNRHVGKTIRADIQISMFERALETNPGNEKLLLKYLQCCQQSLSPAQLLSKWDDVLSRYPTSSKLWLQYITYRLTELHAFSVPSVIEVFDNCLKSLGSGTDDKSISAKLLVFDRLCRFLRDSGYTERAIGLYQALFEWNFYSPFKNAVPDEIKLKSFERFWKREWPRFGEDGATGWFSYDELAVIPYYQPSFEPESFVPTSNFTIKLEDEKTHDLINYLPIRSQGASHKPSPDPHRTVLFEDIRPFLISLESGSSKKELIDHFIRFTVLPTYSLDTTDSTFSIDPLSYNDLVPSGLIEKMFSNYSHSDSQKIELVHGLYVSAEPSLMINSDFPFKNRPLQLIDLIKPSQLQNELNPRLRDVSYRNFINNCMRSIFTIALEFKDAVLSPSLVYFSLINSSKLEKTKALFKESLDKHPSSIHLYLAHGTLLYEDKKTGESRKLFTELVKHSRNQSTDPPQSTVFRVWADLEFEAGCISLAKSILIAYTFAKEVQCKIFDKPADITFLVEDSNYIYHRANSEDTFTMSVKVKIFNSQKPSIDPKSSFSELTGHIDHFHVHGIALFIHSGIEACRALYEDVLTSLGDASSQVVEYFYMRYVSLLRVYMNQRKGFKPVIVRDVLERALKKFPSNTIFLNGYLQLESHFRFAGRLRRYINTALNSKPSFTLWLFAIYFELNQSPGQRSRQAIEDVFESAINCPTMSGATSLWALYFEYKLRQDSPEAALALLKRAIYSCPYSKDLYLLGLTKLQPYIEPDQREDILHIFMEQEIRARVIVDQ